ncbi:MAG: choice-of-anchor tandem repeat NxxGxxAF-containing protein [Planctomycetota bacterium]
MINDSGTMAFGVEFELGSGGVTGDIDRAIVGTRRTMFGESLGIVLREGETAPGTRGVFDFPGVSSAIHTNDRGDLAFKAWIRGTGVTESNRTGVWIDDADGLLLAAREGSGFDASAAQDGSDPRTIETIDLGFNRRPSLSGAGELIYILRFTDGSEAIVASRVIGCNDADLARPYGVISQADSAELVALFFAGDARVAALAAPFDTVSQSDVAEFVRLFFEGCPG